MKSIKSLDIAKWEGPFSQDMQNEALHALENGQVVFLPHLPFLLSAQELGFLNPSVTDPKSKNVSFDIHKDKLGGTTCQGSDAEALKEMIKRYALKSRQFVDLLFPHYKKTITQKRTSFRPVEIEGRKSSYRKDDTRLHVDSFPATPSNGQRILRVFTNVNPQEKPRVWRIGEPFQDVVQKMSPRLSKPFPGLAHVMKALGITKDHRTLYDHYMLQIHDAMKGDDAYQKSVPQTEFHFPTGSSWLVYTDQVSHAAMSGQHVFEQTFSLPAHGIKHMESSPLKILEKHFKQKLI